MPWRGYLNFKEVSKMLEGTYEVPDVILILPLIDNGTPVRDVGLQLTALMLKTVLFRNLAKRQGFDNWFLPSILYWKFCVIRPQYPSIIQTTCAVWLKPHVSTRHAWHLMEVNWFSFVLQFLYRRVVLIRTFTLILLLICSQISYKFES